MRGKWKRGMKATSVVYSAETMRCPLFFRSEWSGVVRVRDVPIAARSVVRVRTYNHHLTAKRERGRIRESVD